MAFLNGELGFHDSGHFNLFQKFNSEGVYVAVLDNLYNQPGKLSQIVKYDAIVVGTTGFEIAKTNQLFDLFESLDYNPRVVIFAPNEEPFIYMVKKLTNTKFYKLDYSDLSLTPLEYLNKTNDTTPTNQIKEHTEGNTEV